MAAPPPKRPAELVRLDERASGPYGPSASSVARPSVFSAEVVDPKTPHTLDHSATFTDITRGALTALSQSPWQARRFDWATRHVASGWANIARAVHSMADARNAAAHCAKQAAELVAETQKVLADASLHRARVLFEIGELDDQAGMREATRDDRIRYALTKRRAEIREMEGASFDRESRRAIDRADDVERSALDRERVRVGVRTERDRARQELNEGDFRAARARPAPPTVGEPLGEDDVERIIAGVGTEAVRGELRAFFRAAIHGDVQSHPLAPLAFYVILRETELRGVPYGEALREAARVVATKLAIPKDQWPKDIAAYWLAMLQDLNAAIEANRKDRLREVLNREDGMFDGTAPIRPQDF